MKVLLKKILKFVFFILVITFQNCEKDYDLIQAETEQNKTSYLNKFIIKTINTEEVFAKSKIKNV